MQEARLFDLLYPGLRRPDLRLYTPVEVELFRPGRSSLLWPSRPPLIQHFTELRLLDFMAWITIPMSTFRMVMERAQQTGFFTLSANEVLGAPEYINFSLSPRSALLFYSFQLSISERGGQRHTLGGPQDTLATVGLHFPVDLFEDLLIRGVLKLWNRRYIDYFFRFFTFQMPIGPLLFSVTIVHRCHRLEGVPQCSFESYDHIHGASLGRSLSV